MADNPKHRRGNPRNWILIILLAILGHFVLLLFVQPSFFGIFKKSIYDTEASSSASSAFPHAIIPIPVDVEGDESQPVEIVESEQSSVDTDAAETAPERDTESDSENILDIVNDAQSPRPGIPSSSSAVIPPKPVEITWPDTKDLHHCLGLRITVRIRVGKEGKISRVEPVRDNLPDDCTDAALRAARRIIFLPGKINGKPAAMWTTLQIDFRDPSG